MGNYDAVVLERVLNKEVRQIRKRLRGLVVKKVVQIGGVPDFSRKIFPDASYHFFLNDSLPADCLFSYTDLPLQPGSCEAIILPHTLELVSEPSDLMTQIEMALAPEGILLVSSFNQYSLLSLCRRFGLSELLKDSGQYRSIMSVLRLLSAAQLAVECQQSVSFRPAVQSEKGYRAFKFMEVLGQMLWPQWGNTFFCIARKQVAGMTGLRPAPWGKKYHFSPLPKPTARM